MERAGIDVISDGEIRRESYSNRFATALDGVDAQTACVIRDRTARRPSCPAWSGGSGAPGRSSCATCSSSAATRTARPRSRSRPLHDGPAGSNEFYRDVEELAMDFAAAVMRRRATWRPRAPTSIQLDEPWLRNDPEAAARYAVPAINRALAGLTVPTALHLCFGYAAVMKRPKPTGYSFLTQLAGTTPRRSRSRPPSPGSTWASSTISPARPSSWA